MAKSWAGGPGIYLRNVPPDVSKADVEKVIREVLVKLGDLETEGRQVKTCPKCGSNHVTAKRTGSALIKCLDCGKVF